MREGWRGGNKADEGGLEEGEGGEGGEHVVHVHAEGAVHLAPAGDATDYYY